MTELGLFARCMYCGHEARKVAHGLGQEGILEVAYPFVMLFVSQMLKTPEAQKCIIDNDNGWVYMVTLCATRSINAGFCSCRLTCAVLPSLVLSLSCISILGSCSSLKMQLLVVCGLQQFSLLLMLQGLMCFAIPVHELAFAVEAVSGAQLGATTEMDPQEMANDIIDENMPQLLDNPAYSDSVRQLYEEQKESCDGILIETIAHLQDVFETNAHQDHFVNRTTDMRAIYSAIYGCLGEFIEPARDPINREVVKTDKLLEALKSIEESRATNIEKCLQLLAKSEIFRNASAMLPELMTFASTVGLFTFFLIIDDGAAAEDFIALKLDLCCSLSLSYEDADRYACDVLSIPCKVSHHDSGASPSNTTSYTESIPYAWSLKTMTSK